MSDSKDIVEIEAATTEIAKVLKNRSDDYDYGRDLYYMAAEALMDILEPAKQLAQESEHPRAIEVASNTATQLADIASKMVEFHMKTERLNNNNEKKQTVNNNLNVELNSKDLLELLTKD